LSVLLAHSLVKMPSSRHPLLGKYKFAGLQASFST
jgi:hypothetical protein